MGDEATLICFGEFDVGTLHAVADDIAKRDFGDLLGGHVLGGSRLARTGQADERDDFDVRMFAHMNIVAKLFDLLKAIAKNI